LYQPESTSKTISQSVQPFLQGSRSWQTDRQTDRQTDQQITLIRAERELKAKNRWRRFDECTV